MAIRVLLADDHPLFREGVAALLRARGFEVVGEANDGIEVLEKARALMPDLILMDVHMPRMDGLAATRVLATELPQTRIVMLTVSEEDADLFEAIKSGAHGYLLKNTDSASFFSLLNGVNKDEPPISRQLAGKILKEFARKMANGNGGKTNGDILSEREKQVLRFVSEGLINRDIAARLSLSENTIKYHLKNILQKLHLRNRTQAVAYAMQSGLLKKN
ncbi:MAG: response regulator transcription factor [Chloroflexi bacterium]|nr:response regulator transcription factor [Chloroflexota bacterium]